MVPIIRAFLSLVLLHEHLDGLLLLWRFIWAYNEFALQQFFSNQNAFFINDIVELCVFSVKHLLVFLLFFVIFVLIIDVFVFLIRVEALCTFVFIVLLVVSVAVQLFQNVLDLSLELLVTLLHQVLQDFRHS